MSDEPALLREIERPSCKPLWAVIGVLTVVIVVLMVYVVVLV